MSNRSTDNPFASPKAVDSPEIAATPPARTRHRGSDSFILGAFGAAFCGLLFSVGYATAVLMLEGMFVPPLNAANFGQFGLLVIYLGVMGAICGLTFAMIPFLRFRRWLPIYCLLLYVLTFDNVQGDQLAETTSVAICVVAALLIFAAGLASVLYERTNRTDAGDGDRPLK